MSLSARRSVSVLFATVLLGAAAHSSFAQECGDVDASGSIRASDALLVLRRAVGIEVELTCETGCESQCGNGIIEAGEACDGSDLAGRDCTTVGYPGGVLACDSSCQLDADGCTAAVCGDGNVEEGEGCDDANTEPGDGCGETCALEDGFSCVGAPSVCSAVCGDGMLVGPEACEGDFAPVTCSELGYASGEVLCVDCQFDTSGCVAAECGNGVAESGEACDGEDFAGSTCAAYGYSTGQLACDDLCENVDTSGCTASCGDGIANPGEDCDGADFNGKTCQDLYYDSGALGCTQGCTFETAGCSVSCEPLAQNCGGGFACYVAQGCFPAGSGGPGDQCEASTDCQAGLDCYYGAGNSFCVAYCDVAAPQCGLDQQCYDAELAPYPGLGICF